MRTFLRELFTGRSAEQESYDSGFIAGVVTVTGLALLHVFAERFRRRDEASA